MNKGIFKKLFNRGKKKFEYNIYFIDENLSPMTIRAESYKVALLKAIGLYGNFCKDVTLIV